MAKEPKVKRKRGRPATLTPEEVKSRNKAYRMLTRKTAVSLTSAYDRWQALKAASKWTHFELADHLMEVHRMHCKCSGSIKLTENQQEGERRDGVHTSVLHDECSAKGITVITATTIADAYTQTEETSFEQIEDPPKILRRKGSHKGRSRKRTAKEVDSKPTESTGPG